MSAVRRFIAWLKTWSLGARVFAVLGLATASLFAFHLAQWREGRAWSDVTILEVRRAAAGYRDGTLRRYELTVRRGASILAGHMNTYWCFGRPEEGQVLDLRAARVDTGHYRFHHGPWHMEFRAWFLVLGLLGLAFGVWRYFVHRARSLGQGKNSRD